MRGLYRRRKNMGSVRNISNIDFTKASLFLVILLELTTSKSDARIPYPGSINSNDRFSGSTGEVSILALTLNHYEANYVKDKKESINTKRADQRTQLLKAIKSSDSDPDVLQLASQELYKCDEYYFPLEEVITNDSALNDAYTVIGHSHVMGCIGFTIPTICKIGYVLIQVAVKKSLVEEGKVQDVLAEHCPPDAGFTCVDKEGMNRRDQHVTKRFSIFKMKGIVTVHAIINGVPLSFTGVHFESYKWENNLCDMKEILNEYNNDVSIMAGDWNNRIHPTLGDAICDSMLSESEEESSSEGDDADSDYYVVPINFTMIWPYFEVESEDFISNMQIDVVRDALILTGLNVTMVPFAKKNGYAIPTYTYKVWANMVNDPFNGNNTFDIDYIDSNKETLLKIDLCEKYLDRLTADLGVLDHIITAHPSEYQVYVTTPNGRANINLAPYADHALISASLLVKKG